MPRLELCGALLGCRLRETIIDELKMPFKQVFHIVDSTIVRAQIQKESYGFGSFVATKIAEIQNKSDPHEWWWVATNANPADMVTRPTSHRNIGPASMWQCGPEFLKRSMEEWPIRQDFQEQELPDRIGVHIAAMVDCQLAGPNVGEAIKLENFSSYIKVLRVTARIVQCKTEKTIKAVGKQPTAQQILDAETLWVKTVQKPLLALDWQLRLGV